MYSEVDPFCYLRMPDSTEERSLFRQEDHRKEIKPVPQQSRVSDDGSSVSKEEAKEKSNCDSNDNDDEGATTSPRGIEINNNNDKSCLGEVQQQSASKVADKYDDNDGFKTPTSSEHRIPILTQCPPAPKKIKPLPSSTYKRKSSSSSSTSCRRPAAALRIDLSASDVDSFFSPNPANDNEDSDDGVEHKFKKAKREEEEDDDDGDGSE